MGLRPGRTIRKLQRPYTRTTKRVAKKAFVKGVPDSRIRVFDMGNAKDMDKYDIEVDLISNEDCNIRHNALESARIAANKYFETTLTRENYYFKVRIYPHHVLREHAILTGAGADRLSSGMQLAFGRPSGRAARVKKGQKMVSIFTYKKFEVEAKKGIRKAGSKFTGKTKLTVSKIERKKRKAKKTKK